MVHPLALRFTPMGDTGNDTGFLGVLEGLVEGSEVWEVARRYRLFRYRHSDAQNQTVEVEVMFNPDSGWRIVATDAARRIVASGPSHPDLTVTAAAVRWHDLDGQAVPPQRSSDE